jgi:hypothetical protein
MQNKNQILPVGTKVVLETPTRAGPRERPEGAVAQIVRNPHELGGDYRVRFTDGAEATVSRDDVAILSHFHRPDWERDEQPQSTEVLRGTVIYRCVVGSQAYGLAHEASDVDRRGIYLPPADLHWSLYGVPGQLEDKATDEVYWEMQKFLKLALKANPNILECLYTPIVEHVHPIAQKLLDMRELFLSKLVYQTYNRYVLSQFKKLNRKFDKTGEINTKHAMHLIRLLISGITILDEGFVPVDVDRWRDRLLGIKDGEIPWGEVDAWRLELHKDFDDVFEATDLPDRPNYERANAYLVEARRWAVDGWGEEELGRVRKS